MTSVNKELESIGKNVGGLTGKIISAAAEIGTSTLSMIDGIKNLTSGASADTKSATDGVSSFTTTLGKVSTALSVVNAGFQLVKSITKLFGADYSEYNELKSKYQSLIGIWDELITKKKKYLSTAATNEIKRVEAETLDVLGKQVETTKILAQKRLDSGDSWGSHSLWYRMWKGSYKFNGQNWRNVAGDISSEYGVKFTGMSDMLNMSPEVLQKIKEEYSGLWSAMDGDFRKYLEQIIAYGDQEIEIIKAAKEELTGFSFDSMKDSFLTTLMDMDSSAEDFSNNFSSYLQKSILRSMMEDKFNSRLQTFYDNYASKNEDGEIDKNDYDLLQQEWKNIVNDAVTERNNLKEIFNWEAESPTATTGQGVATITQDSANQLNGSFDNMLRYTSAIADTANQSLLVQQAMNSTLYTIAGHTEHLINIDSTLEDIKIRGVKVKV